MTLSDVYPKIRDSLVAFVPYYKSPQQKGFPPQEYPPIIGTGFIIHPNGWIATNNHVIEAFSKVYRPEDTEGREHCVLAYRYRFTEKGLLQIPLDVVDVSIITSYTPEGPYFGPANLDLGLVWVNAYKLPYLEIDPQPNIKEGMELSTSGFPMGTDALTSPGWLQQTAPTLQSGIVSSVLPFQCDHPHSFSLNVMIQGGASGSPVFCPLTGIVKGVLYASLNEYRAGHTLGNDDDNVIYNVPTNISYAIPSNLLQLLIKEINKSHGLTQSENSHPLSELINDEELKIDIGRSQLDK